MIRPLLLLALLSGCSNLDQTSGAIISAIFVPEYDREVACAKQPWPWMWDRENKTCVHMSDDQQATYRRNMAPPAGYQPDNWSLNPGAVWTGSPIIFPTGWGQTGMNSVGRY